MADRLAPRQVLAEGALSARDGEERMVGGLPDGVERREMRMGMGTEG